MIQAKNIDSQPILKHLAYYSSPHENCGQWEGSACSRGHWSLWWDDYPYSMSTPFPPDTPKKVMLAKMRSLHKRGLVEGCPCGCRGDWEITDKGREALLV